LVDSAVRFTDFSSSWGSDPSSELLGYFHLSAGADLLVCKVQSIDVAECNINERVVAGKSAKRESARADVRK